MILIDFDDFNWLVAPRLQLYRLDVFARSFWAPSVFLLKRCLLPLRQLTDCIYYSLALSTCMPPWRLRPWTAHFALLPLPVAIRVHCSVVAVACSVWALSSTDVASPSPLPSLQELAVICFLGRLPCRREQTYEKSMKNMENALKTYEQHVENTWKT